MVLAEIVLGSRQSEDDQLERMAQRIRARAITRASDLYMQIESAQGSNLPNVEKDGGGLYGRTEAARDAGFSERQQKNLARIGNIPADEREAMIESDTPPRPFTLRVLPMSKTSVLECSFNGVVVGNVRTFLALQGVLTLVSIFALR